MGQYWKPVNLDKRECIHPHKLGCGLKLGEQIGGNPSTGDALVVLCAGMPEPRGGGDFDVDDNWHGPKRDQDGVHGDCPGPMPTDYPAVAKRTIGRWAGDRIALIGDYAEPGDVHGCDAQTIYADLENYTDVTDDVCCVLEHELHGTFQGEGWRKFVAT